MIILTIPLLNSNFMTQLLRGVLFCHENRVLHRVGDVDCFSPSFHAQLLMLGHDCK